MTKVAHLGSPNTIVPLLPNPNKNHSSHFQPNRLAHLIALFCNCRMTKTLKANFTIFTPLAEIAIYSDTGINSCSNKQNLWSPPFLQADFEDGVGLLKSIRRLGGDISPRHDESRAYRP